VKEVRSVRKPPRTIATKCLSLRQPWAWLVVNGHKDIENRSWETKHRGPLLIHASQRPVPNLVEVRADVWRRFHVQIPDELEYGGVVGQVNVVDCVTASDSPWFLGQVGFVCDDAMCLPFLPMKGRLGIFAVEPGILRKLKRDSERRPRQKRP
jgi:hypothetical protein